MYTPPEINNSSRIYYLRLLKEGKITQEIYDRILDAIEKESKNDIQK